MYKLLVADDEALVREGILAKLASNGFQFDWVGQAADGELAYGIILSQKPDIVLTDIHMPFLDGIELIRKCRESGTGTHFLIITGYAEFEYAKQALEMGVDGYILKPINDKNLVELLDKILESLGREDGTRRMHDRLNEISLDMESLNRERSINQLFHTPPAGSGANSDGVPAELFPVSRTCFAVLLVNIGKPSGVKGDNDSDTLRESARQLAADIIGEHGWAVPDYVSGAQIIAVLGSVSREQMKPTAAHLAEEIVLKLSSGLGVPASASVSGISERLSPVLYRQAKAAMFQRILHGGNRIFLFEESPGREKASYPEHKIRLLQTAIGNGDYPSVEQVLNDIFLSEEAAKYSVSFIRFLFLDISNLLQKTCSRLDTESGDYGEGGVSPDDMLGFFDSRRDIVQYLQTTILETLRQYTANAALCKEVLGSVKEYINAHFTEDLPVKSLARQFAINPNYLSTIFHREVGQTISNYISWKRMEQACRLLTATTMSIAEISQSVGYNDPQYFYKVFKKMMGVTAMEYRSKPVEPVIKTDG